LSFWSAKKPKDFPSGDQNAARAPSVPSRALAWSEDKGRRKIRGPFESVAVKASVLPSGERV
jgi:hypothetical protein